MLVFPYGKNGPKNGPKIGPFLAPVKDKQKPLVTRGIEEKPLQNPNGYEKPENRYPFLVEKLTLPGSKPPPPKHPHRPTYGSDWAWIARAVGGEGPFWFRVHRDAPNRQVATDINTGRNQYVNPNVYQAAAVLTQPEPRLYDLYLRVRPPEPDMSPKGGSESADEWIDAQRARIAELRREWRERWQLEWMHEERRRQREAGLEH